MTQRVVSLHLCHSDGHRSLGTQHGITQYMDSKLNLQDTFFFLTDLFWGRKNTPDLFSRQRTEDRDYQSLLEGCGTQE